MSQSSLLRPPIFVVGAPGSGTTLLRFILDAHPNISCGGETAFLVEFATMERRYSQHLEQYGVTTEDFRRQAAEFFAAFHVRDAARYGKTRWADKTPSYAHHLAYIDALFPTCQVVHIIRNGVDVLASHRERWGLRRAIEATKNWQASIRSARAFGARVEPERYLELRYEKLVSDPETVLRPMFEFLDEPWDPAVLDVAKAPHDISKTFATPTATYAAYIESRRSEGGDAGLIYTSRIGAGKKLHPALLWLFERRNGEFARQLGY